MNSNTTPDAATFPHLVAAIDQAMQRVAARAIAAGATQAQADAAARKALDNHLADMRKLAGLPA